ncbi:MAG TPA: 2-hydroxyacid dehydrogenase [Burkholderiales bacterium]|nr:2-hydroxyacid dehydrogenase [Burkholderiales bacterium]
MSKPEILVLKPIYAPTMAALERDYVVHKGWEPARSDSRAVRALVTTTATGFTREDAKACPALEIVVCFGTPRANFDFAAASERGLVVGATPDDIAAPVADLAVGLLVSLVRRIAEGDRFVRAGQWTTRAAAPGRDLAGKTCGIVGLGQIGLRVARRAEAFGMRIEYHGPNRKSVAYPYHADIVALARAADCLVVTCPLTPQTRGLIDARVLAALGPEGFLVNVARGEVVDEGALLAALQGAGIAGAALDVYWNEPDVPRALTDMDNVLLTPHVGSNTREVRDERGAKLLANLEAHFAGKPVPHVFTAEMAAGRR